LIKFITLITQSGAPSDKVNNPVLCLKYQARPLHSIVLIFKTSGPPIYIILGTL